MSTGPRRRRMLGPASVAADSSIEARDVFCLYSLARGTVAALRGLTLTVVSGERLVVHGPNGSGKTSLLRVLAGEVTPSAGTVRVAGVDLAGADARTQADLRRCRLGIVDQHSARVLRPELDVLDNVALQLTIIGVARDAARRRARDLLAELHLDDLADRRSGQLSGGQAQRVAVCAALAHDPRIVLADEPSGELDADSADQVYDLLAAAAQRSDATLVVVSHDVRAARIADRVVRIRDGRLSEQWFPHAPNSAAASNAAAAREASAGEELVVDDRGWVRLPEGMRRSAGAGRAVRAQAGNNQIVLTGRDRPQTSASAAAVSASAAAERAPTGEPGARLRGVTVRYGERTVLHRLDLDVRSGRVTVLRGRSGSGKSTLLRVLLGLADPDEGEAELAGVSMRELSRTHRADLRRAHAAVALQFGALAEVLDARENLALARELRALPPDDNFVADTIDEVGLRGVSTRPVRLLSGGERQRVALARSLVVRRPLVVLDEPSSAQDEAYADVVGTALRAAAERGTGVLVATHDPRLVAIADDVLDLG